MENNFLFMSQYFLTINGKELWSYDATLSSDVSYQGDIRPFVYDRATLNLRSDQGSFALGASFGVNMLGAKTQKIDVINEQSGDFFTLFADNIYSTTPQEGSLVVIARIGDEIRAYEKGIKNDIHLEIDGDKTDMTPLGAYEMYVRYDDDYYYPYILNPSYQNTKKVEKFFDYYGYRSYEDSEGGKHFILFIEDIRSTESKPYWYFTDNFVQISENIILSEEEYVETWEITASGDITFVVTSGANYYVDRSTGKYYQGTLAARPVSSFSYTRVFEDTDSEYVIAKNEKWTFIIDSTINNLSPEKEKTLRYFQDFYWCLSPSEANENAPRFLMLTFDDQIILTDESGATIAGTDLTPEKLIASAAISEDILQVSFEDGETRSYFVGV